MQGFLKDYPYDVNDRPSVSETDSDIKEITYQDPCAALFQFTENAQSNVASDNYSGKVNEFNFVKPTIRPVSCESTVTYSLYSVTATGDKNGDTKNSANVDWKSSFDSFFDLTYDNDASVPADGQARW